MALSSWREGWVDSQLTFNVDIENEVRADF